MNIFEKNDSSYTIHREVLPLENNINLQSSIFIKLSKTSIYSNDTCNTLSLFSCAFIQCSSQIYGAIYFYCLNPKSFFSCFYCLFDSCYTLENVEAVYVKLTSSEYSSINVNSVCFENCPGDGRTPKHSVATLFGVIIQIIEQNYSNCIATHDFHYVGLSSHPIIHKYLTFVKCTCIDYGLLTLREGNFYLSESNFLDLESIEIVFYSYISGYIKLARSNLAGIGSKTLFLIGQNCQGIDIVECYLDGSPIGTGSYTIVSPVSNSYDIHTCIVKFRLKVCSKSQKMKNMNIIFFIINIILS